jgi:hypothetical protein
MKRQIWIGLALVLVLNVVLAKLLRQKSPLDQAIAKEQAYAEENELISGYLKDRSVLSVGDPINMIGNLATSSFWTKTLLPTLAQKEAIMKLDKVVNEARRRSYLLDAEPYGGSPEVRRKDLSRSGKRREATIYHAQRLVALGLLTEGQADLAMQRYLASQEINALNNDSVGLAEQIELTQSQKAKLAGVNALFLGQAYSKIPDAMSGDPQVGDAYAKSVDAWSRQYKHALWDILTPNQRDKWSSLASERPVPAEPPNSARSPVSEAETADVRILDLSPIFRASAERANALGLSAEQKSLLKDLEDVTRVGYVWIGRGSSRPGTPRPEGAGKSQADQISQRRAEFLSRAEQVALLGILTEQQAEQVKAAVKRS